MSVVTTSQVSQPIKQIFITIYIIFIAFFTTTCASIRPLEGGPKDTTPPKLIATSPVHESLNNFKKKLPKTCDTTKI